jgi:hypothetical protein
LGLCLGNKKCKAIADTGTTLITGPTEGIRHLLNSIPLQTDCKNYNIIRSLEFVFSGLKFKLEVEDYISRSKDHKNCSAMIMPLDVPHPRGPAWILGGVFLTKFYSVYDRDYNKVGFARAKHSEPKVNYDDS